MNDTERGNHFTRAPLAGLLCLLAGLSCCLPAALAQTNETPAWARTLHPKVALTNSPALFTVTLTNTTPVPLRGFCYFEEIPTNLVVTPLGVVVDGQSVTNFHFESGRAEDIYPGCTPHRWWLETPTNFPEANPIPQQAVVRLLFSISCSSTGTFSLQHFGWVACTSDRTNSLYGLSAETNQQTVSFVSEANTAPILPLQTNLSALELARIVVTNTATDTNLLANKLTYLLLDAPVGAAIDTNGVITWTPDESQGPGTYLLITVVTDDGIPPLSATNTFTVAVAEVNTPPRMVDQTNLEVPELTSLVLTNTATDVDLPPNRLRYSLLHPPPGADIDTNGIISWIPDEPQGPGTYLLTTVATDDGIPPLSSTNELTVSVTEVNTPPALPDQTTQMLAELTMLVVTNTATDSDLPADSLSYFLLAPPAGAEIDTNGIIHWTPDESQGPGAYFLTTVASDSGSPSRSSTNAFTVTVTEANTPPVLPEQSDRNLRELTPLVVTNTATDPDLPNNTLSYLLLAGPAGAGIETNGVITWTPDEAQGPSTNLITTVVTDNGTPSLSATNSFTVTVAEVNTPPVLAELADQFLTGLQPLLLTNTATDSDLPLNSLDYVLLDGPAGATLDAQGVLHWQPTVAQVPSTNAFVTAAVDDNPWAAENPRLATVMRFKVAITALHNGPILPLLETNWTISESTRLVMTNTASSSDLPPLTLSYCLFDPPVGAAIDANGIITWTPDASQAPSTNLIVTIVTDNGTPPLSATNSFTVIVTKVKPPPAPPCILSLGWSNQQAVITWSASAGNTYRLERLEALSQTNWSAIPPDITADGPTATLTAPGDAPRGFYRVLLVVP